jgi:hypothetical protein
MSAVALVVAALLLGGTAAVGKTPPSAALQSFWQAFRAAVVASDGVKLAELISFPLFVRGTFDEDPEYHIDRARFAKFLPRMLAE